MFPQYLANVCPISTQCPLGFLPICLKSKFNADINVNLEHCANRNSSLQDLDTTNLIQTASQKNAFHSRRNAAHFVSQNSWGKS